MIGILANGTRPIKGNLIELKGTTSRSAWVISFCYFSVRRDTCSAFLPLSVYKHTQLSVTTCVGLCQLIKYREKRLLWIVFKIQADNLLPYDLLFWGVLLLAHTWDCARCLRCDLCPDYLCSLRVKKWREKNQYWTKKKLANFGCPSNFVTWLQLKLVHISQNECKSAFRLNFCILTELIMFLMYT